MQKQSKMDKKLESHEEIIRIGVDAETEREINEALKKRAAGRRWRDPVPWPSFSRTTADLPLENLPPALREALQEAAASYDQLWLPPEKATGRLAWLKQPLHQLSLYYVNKLGGKQTTVNDALLRLVQELVLLNNAQNQELVALQYRLEALERKADGEEGTA
jgi:hypothetical protein